MKPPIKKGRLSKEELDAAMQQESQEFQTFYLWVDKHMAPSFFEEITHEQLMLIVHNLPAFPLSEYFMQLNMTNCAIVMCLNDPDADIKILRPFGNYGIKNYQTFVSDVAPPFPGVKKTLRIAIIHFVEINDSEEELTEDKKKELYELSKEFHSSMSYDNFKDMLKGMNPRFVRSMTKERLKISLEMFFRAKTRDHCQYQVIYNENWKTEGPNVPSAQVVLAWKNTPKYRFLYRLAKTIHRHNLTMRRVNVTYIDSFGDCPILLMSLGLHGSHGKPAWEEADMNDFLQELVTLKYFNDLDHIETVFIDSGLLRGNLANLLRSIVSFVHQILVHADANLYSLSHIEEAFCRHPELTVDLCKLFELKFQPHTTNLEHYEKASKILLDLVNHLDTGSEINDSMRKNVFRQGVNFIHHVLKTNFYRHNKSAFSFRLSPLYMNQVPYDRKEKFPELPFAIFYIQGMNFIAFHIRFKDLARGGLRTVVPRRLEQMVSERNNVFYECYNLAYTQQKKNKDIPEGGAKAVILLEPYDRLKEEIDICANELRASGLKEDELHIILTNYSLKQRLEYLYQSQRAFVHSLLTLINEDPETHKLRAKDILDYYMKPEYIYLGPDENMHDSMIEWIANYSAKCNYVLGKAFISSKPSCGINHKQYGVTSLGVNVNMEEVLKYLEIDPKHDTFTIKMTGGPDGDVAGNQIHNLYRLYKNTAKLLALIDGSGTIFDPEGLDLSIMNDLFKKGQPIAFYPVEKLHVGGFLLNQNMKKEETTYSQKTLLSRKTDQGIQEEWLSGNDTNHLLRHNVHQTITNIFIPAGGRPRTLNENNIRDFLDEHGNPTSQAIIEGANLYLTPKARRELEKLGVIIIKDSTANKGGVTCSSFEVLSNLTLTEEEFITHKEELVKEILEIIKKRARDEAKLMLKTHAATGAFLTDLSDWVAERINHLTYELLDYLESQDISPTKDPSLYACLFNYCPELIRKNYKQRILDKIPLPHQKAIIACYLASRLVYTRGLAWAPTIADILPIIAEDFNIQHPDIDLDCDALDEQT